MSKNVIVGAGISGLSIGYELIKRKKEVIIIEKSNEVGGLSKSINLNDCIVDLGAHLFYGYDKEVYDKIREIVPDKLWIKIKRNHKLCINKKFVNWPLSIKTIFQLPLKIFLLCVLNVIENFFKKSVINYNDYNDVINEIYGRRLNNIFFTPITKKFLKRDTSEIDPDWAIASLRAATKVKDSKYIETNKYLTNVNENLKKKDFSLFKFLKQNFFNKQDEPFYYFKNGYGTICQEYEKILVQKNANIFKNTNLEKIYTEKDKIKSIKINNEIVNIKKLIWTGNLPSLLKLLNIESQNLNFIHSVFVYVFLKKNFTSNFDCCYFSDPDIIFQRATINSDYSKEVIKNKEIQSVGCFELSYKSLEEIKNFDEKSIISKLVKNCQELKIFKTEDVYDIKCHVAPYSYPVFDKNYRQKIDKITNELKIYKNLYLLGRQGTFSYENLDLIVKESMKHPLLENEY